MKSLPYVISKKAVSELEKIWIFTAQKWSVNQADRYYNLIFVEINTGKSGAFQIVVAGSSL